MTEYITLGLAALAVLLGIVNLVRKQNTQALEQRLADELRASRQETNAAINESVRSSASVQAESQRQLFEQLVTSQKTLQASVTEGLKQNEVRLETIRATVHAQLTAMQAGNEKKLDEMRQTVDEKLQRTLNERLNQSFKSVNDNLEKVYKGLGEMQTLASGVGDLKKVLSNVKTRGILGEMQLGAILEQILAPDQYEANVATIKNSKERVEFAVRLPGEGDGDCVWLPIDAKFPADAYANLLDAYDSADPEAVKAAGNVLEQRVRQFAKDIRDKYVRVPDTTDFGIMFLPVEGLYSEIVRRGFVERLQREYKVVLAGPTTMAALLNSLQMGFRTLAIQKQSSEVWKVLGAVKSEFATFEDVLGKTKLHLDRATKGIDDLMGVRTRQIQRKLKDVTALPAVDTKEELAELLQPEADDETADG